MNIILDTDSYKSSHYLQYPKETKGLFSYLEARWSYGNGSSVIFFGLQYILKKYLEGSVVTKEDVLEAEELFTKHGEPFNKKGWMYIATELKGYLPLTIKALPEGTKVDLETVLMTIECTNPKCYWLVTWFETMLMRVWYPITVATHSHNMKITIKRFLDISSDDPEGQILFKLHDFGSRGVSSQETAMIGGMAHLVNFRGTDTVAALVGVKEYYNFDDMAGFSIPASEHSTITSWGKENEARVYENMIDNFSKPGSLYACVSDSYDLDNAVNNIWGKQLKDKVIEKGGILVVRPDSGNPITTSIRVVKDLDKHFGSTKNNKGYKVLNNVRVIYGDSMNHSNVEDILINLTKCGFSADNMSFGMGAELLQKVNRDTYGMAIKVSAIKINNNWINVYKEPKGAPEKASKKGRLMTYRKENGEFYSALEPKNKFDAPMLATVFKDGEILSEDSFDAIRARVDEN